MPMPWRSPCNASSCSRDRLRPWLLFTKGCHGENCRMYLSASDTLRTARSLSVSTSNWLSLDVMTHALELAGCTIDALLAASASRPRSAVSRQAAPSLCGAFVSDPSCNFGACDYTVFGMNPTFTDRHLWEVKWAHTLDTGHIDSILIRRRTPLVKGVDATLRAEVVFCFAGVELIKRERLFSLGNRDVAQVS
ncbi:hypothetical protein SAMN05216230_104116 [Pseudomonas soli]|uniref:Uncharacterized protein n=1 Tax=Pseudomonas soli TaxID=1306993 RepID=A0A1H9JI79_9PSED|nr:hypothetical protein SAMN05216230_104116 [Pseudomonas soli]